MLFRSGYLPFSEAVEAVARDVAFAGVVHDARGRRVVVRRTAQPSHICEDDYRAVVPDWCGLALEPALLSSRQVDELNALVRDRHQWLAERGIDVQMWAISNSWKYPSGLAPYRIMHDGTGEVDDLIRAVFEIHGPGTVAFVRGHVRSL
jgi:hypothetical protein